MTAPATATAAAQQAVIDGLVRSMEGNAFVGHTKAAQILGMDKETLQGEGDSGHIKYKTRGSRRFYSLPFLVEYVTTPTPEASKCLSTGGKKPAKTAPRTSAKTTTTNSSGEVVSFRGIRARRQSEKQNSPKSV